MARARDLPRQLHQPRGREGLSGDLQAIVQAANAYANSYVLNEYIANNNASLETLVKKHGVQVKKFPDEVLNGLGALSGQVIGDLASKDTLSSEVLSSIVKFRTGSIAFAKVSEQAFYNARVLPFDWVSL